MNDQDVMILGVGQIGQQIARQLCELKMDGSIDLNFIYLCGRKLSRMAAIREDLLSSMLLRCRRNNIPQKMYQSLEKSVIACDLSHDYAVDIIVLSFGAPINEHLSVDKALHSNQRNILYEAHTAIIDSLLPCIKMKKNDNTWILNIANPIEQICQYLKNHLLLDPRRIIGSTAELDAMRGLKYYLRENEYPSDKYKAVYVGCHDEQGAHYLQNIQTREFHYDADDRWKMLANKEGSNILHYKKTPPVFGPSESVISVIAALCSDYPVNLCCSMWMSEFEQYFSVPVEVTRGKIRYIENLAHNKPLN